jgi:hypothetical protein
MIRDTLPFGLQAQGKETPPYHTHPPLGLACCCTSSCGHPLCGRVALLARSCPGSKHKQWPEQQNRGDDSSHNHKLAWVSQRKGGYFVLLPCPIRTACHTHTHTHTSTQATHSRATSRRVGRCWSVRMSGAAGLASFPSPQASSPAAGSCLCCSCPFFLRPRRPGTLNAARTLSSSTHPSGTGRGPSTLAAFWS